jgi:hypothetical protein
MPYLPIDVDGKKKWPAVARGIGVPSVAQGFCDLWEQVWITRRDTVSLLQLECLFGAPGERVAQVLVGFDFLEPMDNGLWRVRGAAKFLRVPSSKAIGGQVSAQRPRDEKGRLLPSSCPAPVQQMLEPPSSRNPALTPITQHPSPNTQVEETPPPAERRELDSPGAPLRAGATIEAPTTDPDGWMGMDFWQWAQSIRQQGGLLAERPPHHRKLSSWWSEARMRVSTKALRDGFYEFGQSKFWEATAPPYPFQAFMSQWDQFTKPEVSDGAAA